MNLDEGKDIHIAGSVLGVGLPNPTNTIKVVGSTGPFNLAYHSLANGAVDFGTNNTMGILTYPTILGTSSAKDLGLYVRWSGTNHYFSETGTTWYTNFTATGGFGDEVPLPQNTADLTAMDITGHARVRRPDAGVYEYRP